MSILKVVGLGMIAAAVSLLVKSFRPEISLQVSIAAGITLFLYAALEISGIAGDITAAAQSYGLDVRYISVIFKALGLSYVTQFASDICRDAGETAIAGKVELCGKVLIVSSAIPGVIALLETIRELLPEG